MVTAGQRIEYQDEYGGFNVTVRPKIGREKRKNAKITAKDRSRMMLLIGVVGVICIGMIIAAAFCASVNYNNNLLKDQNGELLGQVESLEVEIQSKNNIAAIEKKATADLGMVYPEGEKYVIIENQEKPSDDFASLLKKQAFN